MTCLYIQNCIHRLSFKQHFRWILLARTVAIPVGQRSGSRLAMPRMWNSIFGLDAWYHFRLNISCGVAVMGRSHQKKFQENLKGRGGGQCFLGEGLFFRSSSFFRPSSILMLSSFLRLSLLSWSPPFEKLPEFFFDDFSPWQPHHNWCYGKD